MTFSSVVRVLFCLPNIAQSCIIDNNLFNQLAVQSTMGMLLYDEVTF